MRNKDHIYALVAGGLFASFCLPITNTPRIYLGMGWLIVFVVLLSVHYARLPRKKP